MSTQMIVFGGLMLVLGLMLGSNLGVMLMCLLHINDTSSELDKKSDQ